MPDSEHILEVDEKRFEKEVLLDSKERPVLVDFWADWCQPCKLLTPILAQLAVELSSKLKITKVNTDTEQGLAMQYGIRSLPTVMLFVNGEAVNQFSGVAPKQAIEQFLQPYLPRESDSLRESARTASEGGDLDSATILLHDALAMDPENYRIHPDLIELLIKTGNITEAEDIINGLPANIQQERKIELLQAKLNFARIAAMAPDESTLVRRLEEDPDDMEVRYQLSARQVMAGDYEHGMDNLLEIIRRDRAFKDDGGRKALVDVFTLLENKPELVKKYRTLLSTALH